MEQRVETLERLLWLEGELNRLLALIGACQNEERAAELQAQLRERLDQHQAAKRALDDVCKV